MDSQVLLIIIICIVLLATIIWAINHYKKLFRNSVDFEINNQDIFEQEEKKYESYLKNLEKQKRQRYSKYFVVYRYPSYSECIGISEKELQLFKVTKPKQAKKIATANNLVYEYSIEPATKGKIETIKSFQLDEIIYFTNTGSEQYVSEVSGGGSSISGAVIGGMIAGEAGAIIGSRKGISTKVSNIDTRKTVIMTNQGEEQLSFDYYSYLTKLIPQKELSTIQLNNNQNPNSSPTDELRKFKELLDDGIITQEEFDTKKKELLNL